jgi:hypothetical protein
MWDCQVLLQYALTVNASPSWNKIYINVTDIVRSNSSAAGFKIYITAALDASLTQANIYLDNIKLIHN